MRASLAIVVALLLSAQVLGQTAYTSSYTLTGQWAAKWTITGTTIQIEVSSPNLGWVSIGWNPNSALMSAPGTGTDYITGWVLNGAPVLIDTLSNNGHAMPQKDTQQDATLVTGVETGGNTVITFTRPLDTGDTTQDTPITNAQTNLIWAYCTTDGNADGSNYPEHTNYGTAKVNFFTPGEQNPDAVSDGAGTTGTPAALPASGVGSFDGKTFSAKYVVDQAGGTITISMTAQTTGWLSIGWSTKSTKMSSPTDYVTGWVTPDGKVFLYDTWSTDYNVPTLDTNQNVEGAVGAITGGSVTITFRRKLDTGDPTQDTPIINGNMNLIWAYAPTPGASGTSYAKHSLTGSGQVNFFSATAASTTFGPAAWAGFGLLIAVLSPLALGVLIVVLFKIYRRCSRNGPPPMVDFDEPVPGGAARGPPQTSSRAPPANARQQQTSYNSFAGDQSYSQFQGAPPGSRMSVVGNQAGDDDYESYNNGGPAQRNRQFMRGNMMVTQYADENGSYQAPRAPPKPGGRPTSTNARPTNAPRPPPSNRPPSNGPRPNRPPPGPPGSRPAGAPGSRPAGPPPGPPGSRPANRPAGPPPSAPPRQPPANNPVFNNSTDSTPIRTTRKARPVSVYVKEPTKGAYTTLMTMCSSRIPGTDFTARDAFLAFAFVFFNLLMLLFCGGTYAQKSGYLAAANAFFVALPATRHSILVLIFGLPFDKTIMFHRWLGRFTLIMSTVHLILIIVEKNVLTSTKSNWGWAAWAMCVLIFLTSISYLRRKRFSWFYYSHFVFFLFYLFGGLHSAQFIYYALAAAVFYAFDRLARWFYGIYPVKTTLIKTKPGGVVQIRFPKHPLAFYKVGQYAFINFPQLSLLEWHPFSISSGPNETTAEIHVKSLGDHTQKLLEAANTRPYLWVRADGPYGKMSLNWRRYPAVVLVCGGIGITPMMSIIKAAFDYGDINPKRKQKGHHVKHMYLVWSCSSIEAYGWFSDVLEGCKGRSTPRLTPLVHITRGDAQRGNPDLIYERPNMTNIIDRVVNETHERRIAVFACGPAALVHDTWDVASNVSLDGNVRFDFHHEVFEF